MLLLEWVCPSGRFGEWFAGFSAGAKLIYLFDCLFIKSNRFGLLLGCSWSVGGGLVELIGRKRETTHYYQGKYNDMVAVKGARDRLCELAYAKICFHYRTYTSMVRISLDTVPALSASVLRERPI